MIAVAEPLAIDPAEHRGLVLKVANRYRNQGFGLDELIDEAELALHVAIANFDPDRGNQFSTYAWVVIANHIKTFMRRVGHPKGVVVHDVHVLRGTLGASHRERDPSERLIAQQTADRVLGVLTLKSERLVVEHLFGLNGRPELNLAEIAKVQGYSRERARQLKLTAFARINRAIAEGRL
jgi:RNA polymerase sigma factor (sigma-70 family)